MRAFNRLALTAVSVVALAAVVASFASRPVTAGDASTAMSTAVPAVIEVVAEAETRVTPDIATINAGVITAGQTAAVAMAENSEKMNALFAALKKAGVADKDIQSAGISINPQYDYQPNKAPTVAGYQAQNTVNVVVRDLDKLGNVIDVLVAEGMNQLNGPTFGVENQDEALDQARVDAIKKAQARAKLYASAADVNLGRLIKISEQSAVNQPPYPMMRMASARAEAAPTPVAIGEVGLSVSVNMTYMIAP